MATAFYGTIVIQNSDGTVQIDRFDSTDVTAAFATFTSAGGEPTLTVLKNGFIKDVVTNITSAGDTKDFKLWLNQRDTNIRWVQAGSFPTVDNRVCNMTPIPVTAGSKIQLQVIT